VLVLVVLFCHIVNNLNDPDVHVPSTVFNTFISAYLALGTGIVLK